jgi:type I restriction enzyme M protein
LIEASREFGSGTNQNYLRREDVDKIVSTYTGFVDVEKYSRVVSLDEIERNDFNLNMSRYIATADLAERHDVAGALLKLRELERARAGAETRMNVSLRELGYEP